MEQTALEDNVLPIPRKVQEEGLSQSCEVGIQAL